MFLGPLGDELYEVAGGPGDATVGLWLGYNVLPETCFGHLSTTPILDADSDYLADHCELELARGFAPSLRMDPGESGCGQGEPHYAAKYFLDGTVRIAYMPAYYDDCGAPDLPDWQDWSHHGDAEYILVEVKYDPAISRWIFKAMFLSAHFSTPTDASAWVTEHVEFQHKSLSHPRVWVALEKHANYPSRWHCDNAWDDCSAFPVHLRMPVEATKNVGSVTVDIYGCRGSTGKFQGNGRAECFYQARNFHGWYPGSGEVAPYRNYLVSEMFEWRCSLVSNYDFHGPGYPAPTTLRPRCSISKDHGPTPGNPPPGLQTVSISGPGYAYEQGITLTAAPAGPAPLTGLYYEWSYRHCTTVDQSSCSENWTRLAEGVDRRSISDFVTRHHMYADYRVSIRRIAGGSMLHISPEFRVYGAGEFPGGCEPDPNACNQTLRAAPGGAPASPAAAKKPVRRQLNE
ncbi:MAG: hypothetical protein ACKVS7_06460 [Gemmatimonadaceae bacterium]